MTKPALEVLGRTWPGLVMAYPESMHHLVVDPAKFAAYCLDWVEGGVQIIGGCCGTTIEHIRALSDALGVTR